jgi:predicted small lipoprotein YifL
MPLYLPFVLLLALFMVLLPACGKKGPPFLSEKKLTAKVVRLTGKWVDDQIRLAGSIERDDREAKPVGCTIYHAWYPLDHPPCDGCPIKMTVFKGAVETTISKDRFLCLIPEAKKKAIWFFEVRLTDSRGTVGPLSERVKVVIAD